MDMDWEGEEVVHEEPTAFLTFELGDAVFAADVGKVREILDPQKIVPIPGAPHNVLGMIDVRGNSITTVEGADVFMVPSAMGETIAERFVVFELAAADEGNPSRLIAVRTDRVRAVDSYLEAEMGAAPDEAGDHVIASAKRDGETILFVDVARALRAYAGLPAGLTGSIEPAGGLVLSL